jgi:hypothetical protein
MIGVIIIEVFTRKVKMVHGVVTARAKSFHRIVMRRSTGLLKAVSRHIRPAEF